MHLASPKTTSGPPLPPSDVEAEMCLLASMMLDRDVVTTARAAKITRSSFFSEDHPPIFDALGALYDGGKAIDPIILRDEMSRRGTLEDVGGTAYVMRILNTVPSAAHAAHYAAIVREKELLRSVIAECHRAERRCHAPPEGGAADIARDLSGRTALLASAGVADAFMHIGDVAAEVVSRKRDGGSSRIPTGLRDLDTVIGGLAKGRFTLIGGRPGSGKSLLCKQILLNVAGSGEPSGVVTIEESRFKVAENALANFSGVENNRIAFGNIGPEEWDAIGPAVEALRALDVWVNDVPVRLGEVESAVTAAANVHGCRLVVVDYLQLIDPDCAGENENRDITRISKSLKSLAKRLDIALVAVCQLNRGSESGTMRRPELRDLRGSGSLEQDGDFILLLHREDYYHYKEPDYRPTHQLECIVAKNKDGCQSVVPLKFSGRFQRVENWPEDYANNPFN